jgi:hypothetical protein
LPHQWIALVVRRKLVAVVGRDEDRVVRHRDRDGGGIARRGRVVSARVARPGERRCRVVDRDRLGLVAARDEDVVAGLDRVATGEAERAVDERDARVPRLGRRDATGGDQHEDRRDGGRRRERGAGRGEGSSRRPAEEQAEDACTCRQERQDAPDEPAHRSKPAPKRDSPQLLCLWAVGSLPLP